MQIALSPFSSFAWIFCTIRNSNTEIVTIFLRERIMDVLDFFHQD